MGHAIESLVPALAELCEVLLVVPSHFEGCYEHCKTIRFESKGSKVSAGLRELNIRQFFFVYSQILSWKPDLIHILNGDGYPWTIALAACCKKRNIPVVLSVHDPVAHPGKMIDRVQVALRNITYRFVTGVHILSESARPHIPRLKNFKAIECIPHWTTEDLFIRYRKRGVTREPLILFFGRVMPYKGLNTLVKATILLNGRYKTVVAGKGELDEESKVLVASRPELFQIESRFVSDTEIASLLDRSSVCVFPYTHVTQSSVPMIAAAFGVPVVASRLGGFIEDIDETNGVLVPPGDPDALAKGICEAASLKPHPLKDRSVSVIASRLLGLYDNLSRQTAGDMATQSEPVSIR